jgi:ABC-type phosphate transport system auxiliary subunit
MSIGDMLGWVAAGSVFSTFLARSMRPLRILAIISNIAFIAYGGLYHLWPIVGLHVSMLPVNVIRLRQAVEATKNIIA